MPALGARSCKVDPIYTSRLRDRRGVWDHDESTRTAAAVRLVHLRTINVQASEYGASSLIVWQKPADSIQRAARQE